MEKRKSCAIMRSEPLQAEAEPIYCTEFSGEKQYMIRILFVCLGNICRSPMAEFVFRELVRREGLEDRITAESAATSTEALGCNVHAGARQKLQEEGIPFAWRQARQIERRDYARFDHLIGMETRNVSAMRRAGGSYPACSPDRPRVRHRKEGRTTAQCRHRAHPFWAHARSPGSPSADTPCGPAFPKRPT